MSKTIHKYNGKSGKFVCSFKNIVQCAANLNLNESTVRKQVNSKDITYFKGDYYSLRRCDNITDGMDFVEQEPETEIVIEPEMVQLPHSANILIIDIETAPTLAWVWGLWKQNVGINQIADDSFIISYSCKWLLEPNTFSSCLTTQEAILQDDSRLLLELWKWLDSCDVIIAHNGSQFDAPMINTRFIFHGILPPSSYQVIDTLQICRKNFRFVSNKLDYVTRFLRLNGKKKHEGFEMWKGCMAGDEDALHEMELYNRDDVTELEDLYMLLRPFIKPHPNMGLFVDNDVQVCPTCGSSDIKSNGYYVTPMNKYSEFVCQKCGASGRSRHAEPKFKHLINSTSH